MLYMICLISKELLGVTYWLQIREGIGRSARWPILTKMCAGDEGN